MNKILCIATACISFVGLLFMFTVNANSKPNRADVLKVGNSIPNAQLNRFGQSNVEIDNLKGKIKIISIVP
ncbi:MAG: hypothetical protein HOI06_08825, partial [Pelagibacteraceae bacterium]|nr:hypothetical protein [Pelagibacteraceae bacterium]